MRAKTGTYGRVPGGTENEDHYPVDYLDPGYVPDSSTRPSSASSSTNSSDLEIVKTPTNRPYGLPEVNEMTQGDQSKPARHPTNNRFESSLRSTAPDINIQQTVREETSQARSPARSSGRTPATQFPDSMILIVPWFGFAVVHLGIFFSYALSRTARDFPSESIGRMVLVISATINYVLVLRFGRNRLPQNLVEQIGQAAAEMVLGEVSDFIIIGTNVFGLTLGLLCLVIQYPIRLEDALLIISYGGLDSGLLCLYLLSGKDAMLKTRCERNAFWEFLRRQAGEPSLPF